MLFFVNIPVSGRGSTGSRFSLQLQLTQLINCVICLLMCLNFVPSQRIKIPLKPDKCQTLKKSKQGHWNFEIQRGRQILVFEHS